MPSSNDPISGSGFPSVVTRSQRAQPLRDNQHREGAAFRPLSQRERLVMSCQLRGLKGPDIASALQLEVQTVYNIQGRQPYRAELSRRLDECDNEFLALKPKALRAVDNGLESADETTGLRAAELWFKAMGYKGFSRLPEAPAGPVSAEDIATRLLEAGGGKVTIEVEQSTQGQVISPTKECA